MTWTLGIDTSHHVAVGLARDGHPHARRVVGDVRVHAETLMPCVVDLCAEAGIALREIGEIAVGMGPGPFTGLRVGIATAWTLAHAAGLTPRGVSSLDVVAAQWDRAPQEFVIVSDARRRELYWARYRDGSRTQGPCVSAPGDVPDLPLGGHVPDGVPKTVAPGAPGSLDPAILAARWAELAPFDEPCYLRVPDASPPAAAKSTLPRLRLTR